MATLKAFRPYMPDKKLVHMVAELPYDVCNRKEAKIAAESEYNFFHITRSEIDLPDDVDPYDDRVYAKAAENFSQFVKSGILIKEMKDSFYLYTLVMNGRSQTGIIALVSIDDYLENRVKKHELTREEKEQDRIRHIDALEAQTGPVFLMHVQDEEKQALYSRLMQREAHFDFTAKDNVRHILRKIDDAADIELIRRLFSEDNLYIADGHHRAASAVKNGCSRRQDGRKGCEYFLSVIFPHSDLAIMPYNRVVRDLNSLTAEQLIGKLSEMYYIDEAHGGEVSQRFEFKMYLKGKWYAMKPRFDPGKDPVASLDVSVLQNTVLQPLLGINDVRRDKRIDFVGGIRGCAELERLVDSGEFAVAFSMFPTAIEDLIRVSDADMIMPPKSTWFEPKLRSGLCVYSFSDGD